MAEPIKELVMKHVLENLSFGTVTCRVMHDNTLIDEFVPTSVDQLWAHIVIHDLGETARGYFVLEYQQFVESGKTTACYECEACETIEKFGKAIQFKETFMVEFEDMSQQKCPTH